MRASRFGGWSWRLAFLAAGVLIAAGGSQHPRDPTMAEMLANPSWTMSHVVVTAGFAALLAGLWCFRRGAGAGLRRAATIALAGTALQAIEMVVHTAAVVDHGHLVAGQPTPVLSTHLAMAVALYPVFALTLIQFIVAGTRQRMVGSPWIAWLGIIGAAAHGLSAPLVAGLGITGARILFPMLLLFALWLVLAAVWPARVESPRGVETQPQYS